MLSRLSHRQHIDGHRLVTGFCVFTCMHSYPGFSYLATMGSARTCRQIHPPSSSGVCRLPSCLSHRCTLVRRAWKGLLWVVQSSVLDCSAHSDSSNARYCIFPFFKRFHGVRQDATAEQLASYSHSLVESRRIQWTKVSRSLKNLSMSHESVILVVRPNVVYYELDPCVDAEATFMRG